MTAPSDALRIVQINVWSGSTYELKWSSLDFASFETPAHRSLRFESLVTQLKILKPDVITLNECMPCNKYVSKLSARLGYKSFRHIGVAGIVLGPLHVPSSKITEGDAILVAPHLEATFLGRCRLTGRVYSPYFSLNVDDATQALACRVVKGGRSFCVISTHWHASLISDAETLAMIDASTDPSAPACRTALLAGTRIRSGEALATAAFANKVANEGDVVVISGDLNTTHGTPEADIIVQQGFEKATSLSGGEERPTWDPSNPNVKMQTRPENQAGRGQLENEVYAAFSKNPNRLDHTFVKVKGGGGMARATAAVVMDGGPGGIVPADHYGLLVTVTPPPK